MLKQLKRIVQEIAQLSNLQDAMSYLAERLKHTMQVDSCAIYLADYQQQHFMLSATEGLSKAAIGQVAIGFSEGLIGLIGQREEPLNIENAQSHPRYKHFPEVKEEQYHAFLGAPIIHQRKVLGVVSVQHAQIRKFSEEEEAFLVTLTTQLAMEVVNAQARGDLAFDSQTNQHYQKTIQGQAASPGLASGIAHIVDIKHALLQQVSRRTKQTEKQVSLFDTAILKTREQIQNLSDGLGDTVADDVKAIFQIYHHLLDADSLANEVKEKIRQGWTAISALKKVVGNYIVQFRAMSDSYMQERAVDIEDLGNRLLANLLEDNLQTDLSGDQQAILVANEVTASMLAEFPQGTLTGIVSMRGSNNSHAAILARAMGLPAVMGISNIPLSLLNGKHLLLDGYSGAITVSPTTNSQAEFDSLIREEHELETILSKHVELEAVTQDGVEASLLINAGLATEVENEQSKESDGIGLYRTEVPFMLRERFPSEQEQYLLYRGMLENMPDKSVTMRTLDVGGDKPLPYFPINEDNPFLGWRGIRLTLDHPEIFLVQARAMLRASAGLHNLKILLPMVSSLLEVDEAKRLIGQAYHEVNQEQHAESIEKPQIGVMIEVPALVYQIPQLASKVDFLSVGSNDLTQYLLAVDRNNARVGDLYDHYHPAVLAALSTIIGLARKHDLPVTICGELAGEPAGALLLMAMGYRSLSMNTQNLLKIKWVIRSVEYPQAERLLDKVLSLSSPAEVREHVNIFLENVGLGGLVRAGL